jgi:CHASE3 domain sensor protein
MMIGEFTAHQLKILLVIVQDSLDKQRTFRSVSEGGGTVLIDEWRTTLRKIEKVIKRTLGENTNPHSHRPPLRKKK